MAWSNFIWWSDSNLKRPGNLEKIAQHGLTPDQVEHVLNNPVGESFSHSSGDPATFGYTPDDRFIIVIYMEVDEVTCLPITAYDVPEGTR